MRGTKETTEIVYDTYCDELNSPKPSNWCSGSKDYEISDIYFSLIIVTYIN